jgi:hypothetical protein
MSAEDIVAVCFAAFGVITGVLLHKRAAPVVVSILLSTGIAALVYRFLGGIEGTELTVGALKLTGTVAALMGLAIWINRSLVQQSSFRRLTEKSLAGDWIWDYPHERWRGTLSFSETSGLLGFTGNVQQLQGKDSEGRDIWKALYYMTGGTAKIVDDHLLELSCKVQDVAYNREFVWKTTEPLRSGLAFAGYLKVDPPSNPDQQLSLYRWGVSLYKMLT